MTDYREIRLKIPRLTVNEPNGPAFFSSYAAVRVVQAYLKRTEAPMDREVFGALYLNARGRPIAISTISIGTLTTALVHPREVFRPALHLEEKEIMRTAVKEGAVSVIHWHTHPSGCPEPSEEDRLFHQRLVEAGRMIGIPVLDGLIIVDFEDEAQHVSLEENTK